MNVQCHACIGGTNVEKDTRKLDYGQHAVTGTPDRVLDMIRSQNLRTSCIKLLVLDEADEMLSKGFKEQLYDIYHSLPPGVQVVLLSATLPHDVLEMTSKFMIDPVTIEGDFDKETDVETFTNYLMVHAKQLKKSKSQEDVLKSFAASGTLNRTTPQNRRRDHYYYRAGKGVCLTRDFKMSIISAVKVHNNFLQVCQEILQLSVSLEFSIHQYFEKNGCPLKTKAGIVKGDKSSSIYLFDRVAESKSSLFIEVGLQEMIDHIHRERIFVSVKKDSRTTFKGYELPQYAKKADETVCRFCGKTFRNRNVKSRHINGRADRNKSPECPIVLMVNKMRRIDDYWEECKVELVNYQNKTMLIRGWDDLFNKLEEGDEFLDKIIESEHCDERFEKDIVELEDKLYFIKAFFDVWIDVQHKWIYLEGVFSESADIATLLPVESNRFFGVSSEFLTFMDRVVQSAQVVEILECVELENAKNLLKKLTGIEEAVQDLDHDFEL